MKVNLPLAKSRSTHTLNAKNILDRINRRTYASPGVVSWYRKLDVLYKVEEVILQEILPFIKDKKLLDIGIGGGRTTKYLLNISADYTGIDYMPQYAEIAKRKYPQATILCADARDLGAFDESFDFVLFSFNGLDNMEPEGRLKALGEIHRMLKPGGCFMFSTHNRDCKAFNKLPWQTDTALSLGHLKECLYLLAHWPRHVYMKKHERFTSEYAIVNDTAHGFSLLTYYISISEQMNQLAHFGFSHTAAYDMEGRRTDKDTISPWMYYLTRKAPAESIVGTPV
jgi:SAM-dependent methyltransferase